MTKKIKTSDGYTLLTEQFLKVEECEDADGLHYFEIGATKWKIRVTEECAEEIVGRLSSLLAGDEEA